MHFPLIIYIIIQALKTRRTEVRLYASNSLTCAEILINVRSRTLTLTTDERLDGSIFVFEYGAGSVAGWYGAGSELAKLNTKPDRGLSELTRQ